MKSFLKCLTIMSPLVLALSISAPAGVTTRVSVSSDGTQGNFDSDYPSISADGRYVAFHSQASNLVPGDTNGTWDIFVHDRQTGVIERISVSSGGAQGNWYSYYPSISADGRYVAFKSGASNLVAGDTNGYYDIFVRDRQTGQTTRVSVASDGTQSNSDSEYPSINADGRYVAFSSASKLVPGDTNNTPDVFVHDLQTGVTERVSVASDGTQGNAGSSYPFISADGRYVALYSYASNLVPGDTNGYGDVFVRDRQTGQTTRVSVASDGTQGNGTSYYPSISADGRYVAFRSSASNLVPGDTNGSYDVFVHDRQTGITERVSVASDGTQGNYDSGYWNSPCISADGRYVAFDSGASNLVPGDTNWPTDVFVRDRQAVRTTRLSVASDGAQANGGSWYACISADGRYVAFGSGAVNLVPGDTTGWDVFVRDRWTVHDTEALGDGAGAVLSGNTATGGLAGAFYAEDADRSNAVKVIWAGAVTEGDRYRVDGTLDTDENGERCIIASNVRRIDTLPVELLYLRTDYLGGSDDDYDPLTGEGQRGVAGASSRNNIGLFIKAIGQVKQKGSGYLYIDDGALLKDGTLTGSEENIGVRAICDPAAYNTGDYLEVTGISSCFKVGDDLQRRILTRRPEDIRRLSP